MRTSAFPFAILLSITSFAPVASAIILSPVQSATITDQNGDGTPETVGFGYGHPDDPNYGTTLVQKGSGQFPYERRSVEEFTLSGISSVASATLTFSFYNSNGTSSPFETFLASGDGEVQLFDFALSSTTLGSRIVPGNQVYSISYDVTNRLNSLLSGGATFVSVRQQIVGTGGSEVFSPQLAVTPTPEPTSTALIALGSLFTISRRRRSANQCFP